MLCSFTLNISSLRRRQRDYHPDVSPYQALLDTINVEKGRVTFQLLNTRSQVKLLLEFYAVDGNIGR